MSLHLPNYLRRIDYQGDLNPTPPTLAALHLAHVSHIPFENLDVLLGRPIRLDLDALQAKLVDGRRGGYCFEQNALLAAALEAVGFRVERLAARVRFRATSVLPRTHMLLRVVVGEESWIADVGFGAGGLLVPLPFRHDVASRQFAWSFRLTAEPGGYHVLQTLTPAGWLDLYVFTLEPQHPADYEMANHYVATHPASIFRRMYTVQHSTPEARYILRGEDYTIDRGTSQETRRVTEAELLPLLAERFGLEFPAGTRFPVIRDP